MTGPMTDRCRSCGAAVRFVPSASSGKLMILNAGTEQRVVLVDRLHGTVARTADQERLQLEGRLAAAVVDAYIDHHATCPAAKQWKGRTR